MAKKKKDKNEVFYRQGDVILSKTEINIKQLKKKNGNVLAYGEVTGHKHQVIGNDIQLYEGADGQTYLYIGDDVAKVVHEEHDPKGQTSVIDKGVYKVDIQKQYEPEGWTKVTD